jgi:molybdopterin-binding protein
MDVRFNMSLVNTMEISARNVFKGTVKSINYGQILVELVIELPGGLEITSLITKNSAERMQLAEGSEVSTVIKASNVIVALE